MLMSNHNSNSGGKKFRRGVLFNFTVILEVRDTLRSPSIRRPAFRCEDNNAQKEILSMQHLASD
eukprot:scaffold1395_cov152-Amphora_coffeaeformis.AAC.20